MRCRKIGKSEIEASVVGLGTWAIGGWMWGGADDNESIQAIHAAIDAGITLIDTAPVYGFGHSEKVVGKAINGRRDSVVLATKCGLVWHTDKGDPFFTSSEKAIDQSGDRHVYKYLAPESIRYEVEKSLKRLNTDYIDLYQTHWQDSTTAIAESMQELMKLKQEGKIRAIGCSNATPDQMQEYRAVGQLDSDQELYSMLDRKQEKKNLPYVAKHKIAFLAYSPLSKGLLSGKMGPDRVFDDSDLRKNKPRFSVKNRKAVATMLDDFKPVADRHGVSMAQLIVAWTVSQTGCTHALLGARNPQQAEENARAGNAQLTEQDLAAMQQAIERHSEFIVT